MSPPRTSPSPTASGYYQAGELVRCARAGCNRGICAVAADSIAVARLVHSNREAKPGTTVRKCDLCGTLTEVECRIIGKSAAA